MCAFFYNVKMMMHLLSWHLRIDLYDAYKMKLMKRVQHCTDVCRCRIWKLVVLIFH